MKNPIEQKPFTFYFNEDIIKAMIDRYTPHLSENYSSNKKAGRFCYDQDNGVSYILTSQAMLTLNFQDSFEISPCFHEVFKMLEKEIPSLLPNNSDYNNDIKSLNNILARNVETYKISNNNNRVPFAVRNHQLITILANAIIELSDTLKGSNSVAGQDGTKITFTIEKQQPIDLYASQSPLVN